MNRKQKTRIRINIATRAVIAALKRYREKNPGKCIVKRELFPHVERRAGWIMDDDYMPEYDTEAIAPPNKRFIDSHWPDIVLQAAEEYQQYIVWEPRIGVRLGTFREFQETRKMLTEIANGLVKNVEGRNRIIVDQGGKSFLVEIKVKQLPATTGG